MSEVAQKRALRNYRRRLTQRGMARFEVLGLETDRYLIRALAKRMAASEPDASRIRDTVRRTLSDEAPKKGGIFMALRRSPLVGANLTFDRPAIPPRKVNL